MKYVHINEIGNIPINVTLRRVRITTSAVEKAVKCYIF
jgi:hypothetical protein